MLTPRILKLHRQFLKLRSSRINKAALNFPKLLYWPPGALRTFLDVLRPAGIYTELLRGHCDGEYLSLPQSAALSPLATMKTQLETERAVVQKSASGPSMNPIVSSDGVPLGPTSAQQQGAAAAEGSQSVSRSLNFNQSEIAFYQKLESGIQRVQTYEDQRLQLKALQTMPVRQLQEEAAETLTQLKEVDDTKSGDNGKSLDIKDCLVLALLKWFKNSFFRWMDAPSCRQCGGKTSFHGNDAPTPEDLRFEGNRVEKYRCDVCGEFTRFVRYNDPGKLLETREGRCGEWANCFTLCCRALGFEARYVLDWTDHVWTEVYSDSQERWVHCDPCENACDKPLLYELGWGKKLTYVIAFSIDDVEDVTWRYSANFEETLKRRTECRESWLVNTLYNLDKQKWSAMPEAKQNVRLKRKIAELVELITPKKADGQNLSGRTTGSMAWRLARGEIGGGADSPPQQYIFNPTPEEITQQRFHVSYSCAKNEYTRNSDLMKKTKGFQTLVHEFSNIFRKEEHDWKMVYLARTEKTDKGEISWKFDFKESGLVIDSAELRLDTATYHTGRVIWTVCNEDTCFLLTGGPSLQNVLALVGVSSFTLTATLTGGEGDIAWQHTQLFRQSLDDAACPFEVKLKLSAKKPSN
ncbi:hypothetical protein DPMN_113689 [Dreissena polymorpha]|uniref:Peptide-N(4)-(N-acetyl-beta-glucosaminyl)asparagine amidase n=1 Tax=Dreissena polymorpha TaxID=45954 RepID=A0A9D4QRS1_DREPO|nr:hypothetical protein DPMN_113689 [Dreissena polymorpha]